MHICIHVCVHVHERKVDKSVVTGTAQIEEDLSIRYNFKSSTD